MRLSELYINETLSQRLRVAITHLSDTGVASGVHHNDGLRIRAHSRDYVEIVLRYVHHTSAPSLDVVRQRLAECGLRLESNCSHGWNKEADRPGRRWEEAYEVGVDRNVHDWDAEIEKSYDAELVDGVYCSETGRR